MIPGAKSELVIDTQSGQTITIGETFKNKFGVPWKAKLPSTQATEVKNKVTQLGMKILEIAENKAEEDFRKMYNVFKDLSISQFIDNAGQRRAEIDSDISNILRGYTNLNDKVRTSFRSLSTAEQQSLREEAAKKYNDPLFLTATTSLWSDSSFVSDPDVNKRIHDEYNGYDVPTST